MHLACVIGLHVPFDPNEGWNAYSRHGRDGGPARPTRRRRACWSTIIRRCRFIWSARWAQLTGDAIIAGRIVSLAVLFWR